MHIQTPYEIMLMNAIVTGSIIRVGEEIVAGEDIYGGSDRLLSQVIPKRGVIVKLVQNLILPVFM